MAGGAKISGRHLLMGAGILLVGGVSLYLFYRCGSGTNTAGTDQYEVISEHAERVAEEVSSGITDTTDSIRRAGKEVADSLNGVGKIRQSADTITAENQRMADAFAELEAGIQRIEQILQQAEQRKCVMEGNGRGSSNTGHGDNPVGSL